MRRVRPAGRAAAGRINGGEICGGGRSASVRLLQPLFPQPLGKAGKEFVRRNGQRIGQPDQRPCARLNDAVLQIVQ